jgi:serine phosphatase RsbU (regulator of sigma subunit)
MSKPLTPPASSAPAAAPASAPQTPPDPAPARTGPSQASLAAALVQIGENAHSAANLNDLLKTSSRHCRKLVDCESVRIWVARRSGRRLVARDFPETGESPVTETRIAPGEGLAGWVFAEQRALRLGKGDPTTGFKPPLPPFRSALVVPLYRRGQVFAVIECLNRMGLDGFTDEDVDKLDVASEHIAFALDNALLFQETERRSLEKEVLLDVGKTLAARLELDEVIEAILKSLRQVVDYDAGAIYLVDPGTQLLELVSDVGYPDGSDEAFSLQMGVGVVGWVAKSGQPVIVPDVTRDPRYVAARLETRSELAAPLQVEGRTIGVFNLESDLEDAYHEGHLEILATFASHAALAIERARLTRALLERRHLERELEVAREIQASFLPKRAPSVSGFDLAGTAMPHQEVGGDYYDFIRISETRLGLAIADVSGKSIPAALLMAGFRMALLAEIRNEFAIRAVMRKVNTLLYESTDRDKFVTAVYGVLDFRNRVLIVSNAGHNPPIVARADGTLEYIFDGGVALGILPDATYEERPIALKPGDVLIMYTDGVTEAESPAIEHFGQMRLESAILALRDRGAQAILDGIVEEVLAWCGDRGQSDDLTLMVVKVLAE